MRLEFSDKELVEKVLNGGKSLDEVMRWIYLNDSYRKGIENIVSNYRGQVSDVEDVFQDGITHLIMNIRKEKFKADSSLKTYFTSICKNLWLQKIRRSDKLRDIKKSLIVVDKTDHNPEKILIFTEKSSILSTLLDQIGDACKQIISLWSLGYSMKEITLETSYKSEGVVRKKKYFCMQKLIALVKEHNLMNELSNRNE